MEREGSLHQVDGTSVFSQVRKRITSPCKGLFRVPSILDGRFQREVVLVHKFERMGTETHEIATSRQFFDVVPSK